jgi:hypothetical protein
MTAVWLHGSGRIVEAARLLDDEVTKLWDTSQVQHLTPLDWNNATPPVHRSAENVISLIRAEFGSRGPNIGFYPARHSPEEFCSPKR